MYSSIRELPSKAIKYIVRESKFSILFFSFREYARTKKQALLKEENGLV
jgi:hypothetical protein